MAARQASRHVIKTSAQLGTMHLTWLFALLSPFPLAASATSSEPLKETDQPCGDSEVCTPLDRCLSHRSKLDSLPKESQEYKEYINLVKQLVCNKKEKGICCSDGAKEEREVEPESESIESQDEYISQDEEEEEEEEELDSELFPRPIFVGGPRPKIAPDSSKCCRDCIWHPRRKRCVARRPQRGCCPCNVDCPKQKKIDN